MGLSAGASVPCVLLVLLLSGSAAAEAPQLVRGGDSVPGAKEGVFFLHAGGERPTSVRVHATYADDGPPVMTDHMGRSSAQWSRHAYAVPEEADGAQIRAEGPVWVATGAREVRDREFVLDCASVGGFVFWDVETPEVRLLRDDRLAPHLRLFTPVAGPLVPDEAAVRDHTMLLSGEESPLFFEVVAGQEGCAGRTVLQAGDDPDAAPFGETTAALLQASALAAALCVLLLAAVWMVGRRRDRRRRSASLSVALMYVGPIRGRKMLRVVPLLMVLIGLVCAVPASSANEWGVHEVPAGGTVSPPGETVDQWVCVWADAPGDEVVLQQDQAEGAPVERAFTPAADAPDCRLLPSDPLHVGAEQEGTVRVLLLLRPPQAATSPGVVRIATSGVALALDQVTSESEVGVLPDGAGVVVSVVRAADLSVVREVVAPGEQRFAVPGDASELWVVLVEAPGRSSALVDWEDPSWYAAAPTIGHIAVVVAIALFLILYHGRSPRRLG